MKKKPNNFANSKIYRNFLNELKKIDYIKNNFLDMDIFLLCRDLLLSNVTSTEDVGKWMEYALEKPFEYHFYFRIGYVNNETGQDSLEMGNGKLLQFSQIDKDARNRFNFEYSWDTKTNDTPKKTITLDPTLWFMYIKVNSKGLIKARTRGIKDAERNLNIYKLLGYQEFPSVDGSIPNFRHTYYVKWPRGDSYFNPTNTSDLFLNLSKENYDSILQVNKIVNSKNNNEIESRILTAIDILGLINENTSAEIIILFCIISLEKLLMDKEDKETLGWKLSERVSFLISDNPMWINFLYDLKSKRIRTAIRINKKKIFDSRIKLNKRMKHLYGLRSSVTHAGNSSNTISPDDIYTCYLIVILVIDKLLILLKEGIKNTSYDYGKEQSKISSLLYYIDKKKFNVL